MGQASSSDLYVSKVVRLSIRSCLGPTGLQNGIEIVCPEDRNLEELFLIVNRGNKWVKAVIRHRDSDPITGTSECIIEGNIGLYRPYWTRPQGRAVTRIHMPCRMQQEVFVERIALMETLWSWMNEGRDWNIQSLSMPFLGRHDVHADVKHTREIARGISEVSWRGRTLVLKNSLWADVEFDHLKRVSPHPNIISGFGELCERLEDGRPVQKAYFMEHISGGDLKDLIVDERRRQGRLPMPPFPSYDTLDILLQFAHAVKHIHQRGVVHCDLKSANVLISDRASSSRTTSRYRAKVIDFESARLFGRPEPFLAGGGTHWYQAPESYQRRGGGSSVINYPDRIDVYSFGVVAFELLTGEIYSREFCESFNKDDYEREVIDGTLRPPLRDVFVRIRDSRQRIIHLMRGEREFFERFWHLQQEDLISLVESCWDPRPARRPSFLEICDDLNRIDLRLLQEWESR